MKVFAKTKNIIRLAVLLLVIGAASFLYYWFIWEPKDDFKVDDFTIKQVKDGEKPFQNESPVIDLASEAIQKDMNIDNGYSYLYEKGKPYNPTNSSRMILNLIDSYRQTQNQAYLDKAKLYTDALLKSKINYRGAYFFKFEFDYRLQGTSDKEFAPWYSGLAQGRALSIFSRLYAITGDKQYLDDARHVFRSLELLRVGNKKPWIAMTTPDGYFWIEEYPLEKNDYVLNGFLYSIFGLYDYYEIEKTPESEKFLKAALTTAKAYIPKYRQPGKTSFYCLKHKSYNPTYHKTHIKEMGYLYKITGDNFFKEWAEIFTQDRQP